MLKRTVNIITDKGTDTLDIVISFDNDDLDEVNEVTIRTNYNGEEITAIGSRYPFEDAYAELQRKLPENVRLAACVACRFGNMCPVGNAIDEVFCTSDVDISEKSDLYYYTEDEAERSKRSRHFSDFCADFQPQEEDVFTYNDYYSYLTGDEED